MRASPSPLFPLAPLFSLCALMVALAACSIDAVSFTPVPSAPELCGNGLLESGEACDDGNAQDGDGCDANCRPTGCGNGVTTTGELCDDGNDLDGDGCDSNCTTTRCGNGLKTDGEACDDGNSTSGDGCDANCRPTGCGNGVQTAGEGCDDGNTQDGDGCDNNCTVSGCGNGVISGAEMCDDGNTTSGDGCDSNCTVTRCGNGIPTTGEACDDGNTTNGDGCDSNCKPTGCGNGVQTAGEFCDDGNLTSGDGCDANCTITACGNGVQTVGEFCDDGNLTSGDGCDANCTNTACGNGVQTAGEFCDDGNAINGDGCDNNCKPTGCGNGVQTAGEFCDDGNLTSGDGCDANCTPTGCGNGIPTGTEQCDDGNTTNGDGCESNCTPTPPSATSYIKASNTDPSDNFGIAITISADGSTLAVGAHVEDSAAIGINGNQADNSATNAGAVYVFVRSGATWVQQAYIKASNTGTGDQFGVSVALSADGSTLAVGARIEGSAATGIDGNQADNSAANAGAVYVFTRSNSVWRQQAYVKASNTNGGDLFGQSVALSGDGSTLAVGAYGEDSAATGVDGTQTDNSVGNAGAAYVFVRSGTTWAQQAYIKATNTDAGDNFGYALSLSSDGSTLAVSAYAEDSAATGINGNQADNSAASAGAVYVYTRSGTTWSPQAYVKASNTNGGDQFGFPVTLSGDGSTLAVAANQEDSAAVGINGDQASNSASAAGAVYVFVRSGPTWVQQAYVKASNTDTGDQFGIGFALSANGSTLAVGALLEDSAATGINGSQNDNSAANSGAAYVFTRTGTTWSQRSYVKATNTGAGDQLGYTLALSGDGLTLAVCAPAEDSAATGVGGDQTSNAAVDAGAVYVYR
jgi:cysteine-rich repeat protein